MEPTKIIHSILKQIEWDFVLTCTKQLNLNYSEKEFTKNQLVEELTDILKNIIETDKSHYVTDFWTINYQKAEGGNFTLEVIFTPIIVWVDTFAQRTKRGDEISNLKQKLKLALEIEDYIKAESIKKDLEKVLLKQKK